MPIIDIRQKEFAPALAEEIWKGLDQSNGKEKTLPTMLLYDEHGLKLFEEITYLDEYYLTNTEMAILEQHASAIADRIKPNSKLVELGSGNLRKIIILLDAIEQIGKDVEYYALDISQEELQRTIAAVPHGRFRHVQIHGLLGTYEDGFAWLQKAQNQAFHVTVLMMGSSIGNFSRAEAADFLGSIANVLKVTDQVIVGIDGCQSGEKVYRAYNDREGKTHDFIRNGLNHANKVLGEKTFKQADFEIDGVYCQANTCHIASFRALSPMCIGTTSIRKGETIRIEESHKYSPTDCAALFRHAGLVCSDTYADSGTNYTVNILRPAHRSELAASDGSGGQSLENGLPHSAGYAPPNATPSLENIKRLRRYISMVTFDLPRELQHKKFIELRNPPKFYGGHIVAFWDLQLSKAMGQTLVDNDMATKFKRGVDPDVNNPNRINHPHTKEFEWEPVPMSQVISYRNRVWAAVDNTYHDWLANGPTKVPQALWESHEHDAMHIETCFYGIILEERALPIASTLPDFFMIAKQAEVPTWSNEWVKISERDVNIGAPRSTNPYGPHFWDNEVPNQQYHVPSFEAKARGITIGEYAWYMWKENVVGLPASWKHNTKPSINDRSGEESQKSFDVGEGRGIPADFIRNKYIETTFGPQPLARMLSHPFMGSFEEASSYATSVGGRIPTREEEESIYVQVEERKAEEAQNYQAATVSAVNGELSNSGVEESPPLDKCCDGKNGGLRLCPPGENYADLKYCNVGFRHFHTTPIANLGNRLCGRCENGGTWMWTSSVFKAHPGFTPMETYEGYSADFMKGEHYVVLGGSWATHPQIAGRKSFVNFFQPGYRFAWIGARVVRDL